MTRDTLAMLLAWPAWVFVAWVLPRLWRNPLALDRSPPSKNLRAISRERAFLRAVPLGAMIFLAAIPPTFVLELVAEGATVGIICRGLILVVGLAAFALIPAVVLYNRPSFLVAPDHRALPGLLAERRGASPTAGSA